MSRLDSAWRLPFMFLGKIYGHHSLRTIKNLGAFIKKLHCNKGKRDRDGNPDQININVLDDVEASSSIRQKEEGDPTSEELMNCDTSLVTERISNNVDSSSFSCLTKTYDMPESELKLKDVIEFIGIYTFDPELAVHKNKDEEMFDLLEDEVLSHLPPSKIAAMFKIGNSKDLAVIPDNLSDERKGFIRRCLQHEPSRRPTASELLQHPFVCNVSPIEKSVLGSEPLEKSIAIPVRISKF